MRFMPLLMHFMPKPKKNATVEDQIAMPRKMFSRMLMLGMRFSS